MNKCKISAAAVCFPGARIPFASRYRQLAVSSFPVRSFPERSVSPIPWVGSCRSLPRPTIFALLAVFAGNSSRLPCLTSANRTSLSAKIFTAKVNKTICKPSWMAFPERKYPHLFLSKSRSPSRFRRFMAAVPKIEKKNFRKKRAFVVPI